MKTIGMLLTFLIFVTACSSDTVIEEQFPVEDPIVEELQNVEESVEQETITKTPPIEKDTSNLEQPYQENKESCLDNLERFSGTYILSVKSREVGIQDYSPGEEYCGSGADFFGNVPTIAVIEVTGKNARMKVNTDADRYSVSGTFEGPTAPKKPLVAGSYYKKATTLKPIVNSCGVESPYFSFSKKFSEDDGQTTLTMWIYGQEDAITIVAESFWLADDSDILSPCHGLIIIQGEK